MRAENIGDQRHPLKTTPMGSDVHSAAHLPAVHGQGPQASAAGRRLELRYMFEDREVAGEQMRRPTQPHRPYRCALSSRRCVPYLREVHLPHVQASSSSKNLGDEVPAGNPFPHVLRFPRARVARPHLALQVVPLLRRQAQDGLPGRAAGPQAGFRVQDPHASSTSQS